MANLPFLCSSRLLNKSKRMKYTLSLQTIFRARYKILLGCKETCNRAIYFRRADIIYLIYVFLQRVNHVERLFSKDSSRTSLLTNYGHLGQTSRLVIFLWWCLHVWPTSHRLLSISTPSDFKQYLFKVNFSMKIFFHRWRIEMEGDK